MSFKGYANEITSIALPQSVLRAITCMKREETGLFGNFAVTPQVLNQLASQFSGVTASDSGHDTNSMVNLVVHLVSRMEEEMPKVLQFLLSIADPATETSADGESSRPLKTALFLL